LDRKQIGQDGWDCDGVKTSIPEPVVPVEGFGLDNAQRNERRIPDFVWDPIDSSPNGLEGPEELRGISHPSIPRRQMHRENAGTRKVMCESTRSVAIVVGI
jgi:hypothetical protein